MTELNRRRKDRALMRSIREYLGELPAGWPPDKPIATLNRYMATARVEDIAFSYAARSIGMRPFWPKYLSEKYTATNAEKVSCLRPRVQRPKLQTRRSWLVDDQRHWVNSPLGSISVGDLSLQELHQQARRKVLDDDVADNVFDISDWNQSQAIRFGAKPGESRLAPYYYHGVMGLYIAHGILFEDFDGGPNEGNGLKEFVDATVIPAIKSVTAAFGLEPLIVRLPYCPGFLDYPSPCGPIFDAAIT